MRHDQADGLRKKLKAMQDFTQAKTIAVISGKGGVGKSNITINFSLELVRQRNRVLVIDMDIGMGNIDILLGLHVERTIIDMFEEHLSIQEIIQHGPGDLDYIAAGSGLSDIFSIDQHKRNFFFQQYKKLVNYYDFIIFDMGAGITQDSLSIILASDECFVITTPEPTSITDAYSMIKHIVSYDDTLPMQVIMNRSHSEKEGWEALRRFNQVIFQFLQVETKLLGTLPEDRTVTTAVIRQTPYVLLKKNSAVARAMKQLVKNYCSVQPVNQSDTTPSFLGKLKQLLTER
ncbi:MAG: MinD/ParA family protein [Bacillota bacterium]|uniref:MinD/ParA family protein n=1 Tax=Virgibacillus salarius TaxID=447199 RepID=A0A941IB20_9BACI|nr:MULTISPECIES: MinD/ParA family protein [Bacillaceae]NAZ07570.1 AAA family ATPase [Agaribacter marinus]MBR7794850.1 MinD/ParA family protein [Virgibacillus salarius]MCC2249263.1 MinD/ParA family protein [Virgibacillus sp. AGTR]MDY7043911.1 MinD/ParA family protein [Virgibacillus sp. M23]QRZ17299.1 MinD/ParA family protein [Virgibacillus sp. AGTR]